MSDADIVTCGWNADGTASTPVDRTSSAYALPSADSYQGDIIETGSFGEASSGSGCGFIRPLIPSASASSNKAIVPPDQTGTIGYVSFVAAWGIGSSSPGYHGSSRTPIQLAVFAEDGTFSNSSYPAPTIGVAGGTDVLSLLKSLPLTYLAHGFIMFLVWGMAVPISVGALRILPGSQR